MALDARGVGAAQAQVGAPRPAASPSARRLRRAAISALGARDRETLRLGVGEVAGAQGRVRLDAHAGRGDGGDPRHVVRAVLDPVQALVDRRARRLEVAGAALELRALDGRRADELRLARRLGEHRDVVEQAPRLVVLAAAERELDRGGRPR